MTSSLKQTQALFWEAITYPTGVADYLKQLNPEQRTLFEATFADSSDFSRLERMEVYAEAYFFRLLDVLADMYPVLYWQLGQERFHNLVTDYLLAHPSQNPNLRHLGDALPAFLASHEVSQSLPHLPDLTRVELAISQALDSPDSSLLTRSMLAQVDPQDWPAMHLDLVPSLQLLQSGWNFREFRDAQLEGLELPRRERSVPPFDILVWRKGFTVFTRTLQLAEATLLSTLQQGSSFGEASALAEQQGADAQQVVAYLGRWLQDELLAGVRPNTGPPRSVPPGNV